MDEIMYNHQIRSCNNKTREEILTFLEDWNEDLMILERELEVLELDRKEWWNNDVTSCLQYEFMAMVEFTAKTHDVWP